MAARRRVRGAGPRRSAGLRERSFVNAGLGRLEDSPVYADQFQIYHGNANPDLARKICRYLATEPRRLDVFKLANDNIFVKILENVREKDVFLVQPTCNPADGR